MMMRNKGALLPPPSAAIVEEEEAKPAPIAEEEEAKKKDCGDDAAAAAAAASDPDLAPVSTDWEEFTARPRSQTFNLKREETYVLDSSGLSCFPFPFCPLFRSPLLHPPLSCAFLTCSPRMYPLPAPLPAP